MTLHKNLTGNDLHEPKGIASATAGQAYISDGAGSGEWTDVIPDRSMYIPVVIPDISTASTVYVVCPHELELYKIYLVTDAVVTGTTANITAAIDGTPVTGSDIAVTAAGSGAGVVYSSEPTAAYTADEGAVISVTTDGLSSGACKGTVLLGLRYPV